LGHGWAPGSSDGPRQKDRTRTKLRAQHLRKELTPSEKKLWRYLRDEPDAHFRKQVAVGDFVFDFAEYGARLLIELDGGIHALPENALRDARKDEAARVAGFKLLRLTNNDIWTRPDWVLDQVRMFLKAPHPLPPPREGAGDES
jgi:very-short-patch-repair endonuclease